MRREPGSSIIRPLTRDDLYSTYADTIESVIGAICRRHRLPQDQAEELGSLVRLKLLENDSAALGRFEGRSSLRTYLVAIGERVLLDWRAAEWGKWRPCQEARRMGPVAVALDRLLTRDGLSFDEASEQLLTQGVAESRAELDAIRPRLAERSGRRMVSSDVLEHMPARGAAADADLLASERRTEATRAGAALCEALGGLPPQDQLILRLRFQDGFTVARIAELIGEEQKPLYRRFERLFARLREALSAFGVSDEDVSDLFSHPALELAPVFAPAGLGKEDPGPSTRVTPGGRHA